MTNTKWVVSKYAPKTGERFELAYEPVERESFYKVKSKKGDILYLYLDKSEYIPCPPPERWEKVPIQERIQVFGASSLHIVGVRKDERFRIVKIGGIITGGH